ncbi:MAG: serine/threonine-protein kinase [Myxococcales bacterium]
MARAGDVVGGKYRLVHPLGIGGMGTVWRAEHLALQQQVAIKLLDARGPAAERAVKRFQREAQIAASIRHQNIVYISDFGAEGGAPYLVMELLAGVPLAERMVVGEPLGVVTFLRLMDQTLQGLTAVHAAGVVHRDMKPENIFLVRGPNDVVFPKLLDFGVSRSTERNAGHTITREGIVMGTPEYVSPEQARGRMADVRSDIYSLGVVMYEALAGRLPFQADNAADLIVAVLNALPIPLVSLRPDLGEAVSALVGKAMARQPDDRFQSAEEMRLAVLDLVDDQPDLEEFSLPRRFVEPKPSPSIEPPPAPGDALSSWPQPAGPTLESMHPTQALPQLVTPLRKRIIALGFGAVALVLALAALAFVTTGGEPSPAARAKEEAAPPVIEPPVVAKPEAPTEVLIDLHGMPPGAQVRVDGRETSDNPLRLPRASGQHQITIEAPGMRLWSVMHDSTMDGRYAVSLEPEAPPENAARRSSRRSSKSKSGLLRRPDF